MRPLFCLHQKWINSHSLCFCRKLCCVKKKCCFVFLVGFPAWASISMEALFLKTCFYSRITALAIWQSLTTLVMKRVSVVFLFLLMDHFLTFLFLLLGLCQVSPSCVFSSPLSNTLRSRPSSTLSLSSCFLGSREMDFLLFSCPSLSPTPICGCFYLFFFLELPWRVHFLLLASLPRKLPFLLWDWPFLFP